METFLLCTAALANLTSLHPPAVPLLLSSSLLPALLVHPAASSSSPYIQDQVITLVANMARLAPAREQLVAAGALPLLLDILATSQPGTEPALVQAGERTLSKAALALARLCKEASTADLAVKMGATSTLAGVVARERGETVALAVVAAVRVLSCRRENSLMLGEDSLRLREDSLWLEEGRTESFV